VRSGYTAVFSCFNRTKFAGATVDLISDPATDVFVERFCSVAKLEAMAREAL